MGKDLPMPSYLCTLLKSTTRTERISCAAAVAALIACITLVTYFSLHRNKDSGPDDVGKSRYFGEKREGRPHHEVSFKIWPCDANISPKYDERVGHIMKLGKSITPATRTSFIDPDVWNITREMWLARPYNYTDFTHKYEPLKLVIVQHTVGADCYTFANCAAELRNLQSYYISYYEYDIPYNFLIGNDGRVYEGRGWSVEGAHTVHYNRCTIGLGFIGDYRSNAGTQHSKVTEAQLNRTLMLLEESVRQGFLDKNYYIVGAKDLQESESPGDNLYNELKKFDHYDHKNRFYEKSCDEIEEIVAHQQ